MPLFIRWLPPLFAAFGGIGERHFKAAARSLAAFAVLVNGYARQLGEEAASPSTLSRSPASRLGPESSPGPLPWSWIGWRAGRSGRCERRR
jgi:hypothetical protein